MVDDLPERSEINDAFERLLDGDPTPFSVRMSESPVTFATIVIAFLGVLVQHRFGAAVSRSELSKYAKDIHRAREADGCPPLWVVETALRASSGEVSLLEQSQSEELYEAVGLLIRSLLRDLNLNGASKAALLLKADEIIQESLLAVVDENPLSGSGF